MTAPRPSWRVALGTSLALALTVAIPAAAEEEEGPIGHDPTNVIPLLGSEPIDLLGPAGSVLSSQAWLMAGGSDPTVRELPTSDPALGPDLGGFSGACLGHRLLRIQPLNAIVKLLDLIRQQLYLGGDASSPPLCARRFRRRLGFSLWSLFSH